MIGRCQQEFPDVRISLHLHDTRGLGLTNIFSGYEAGARAFDVCTGGLGGCPFVKGAAGNVPTEDAVNMFEGDGDFNRRQFEDDLSSRDIPGKCFRSKSSGANETGT